MQPLKDPNDKLHDRVAASLKDYILREGLRAGDKLPSEHAVAEMLGVSRASVREAVRTLTAVGIVEVKNGKGVFVREFAWGSIADHLPYGLEFYLEDVQELVDIRQLLEIYAIKRIVGNLNSRHLEEMINAIRDMQEKAVRGEDFIEDDIRFHAAIADAAGQRILKLLLSGFWHLQAKIRTVTSDKSILWQRYLEHQAVLDALIGGDVSAAVHAMQDHFANLRGRYGKSMNESEEQMP